MYKGNKIALEDLRNNTICVKTLDGIRTMQHSDDIYLDLVYVNNISTCDQKKFLIHKGEYCRYIDATDYAKLVLI